VRCFETEAELVDLLDGRLAGAAELAVHAHLEGCVECRRRAEAWGRLVPLMRRLAPAAPSPLRARRMEVEIERLLLERPPMRRPAAPRAFVWAGLAVAAVAAVALAWRVQGARDVGRLRARVVALDGAARWRTAAADVGARLDGPGELAIDKGVVSLVVADASLKVVGPARLTLAGDVAHVALRLARGTLEAAVAHRAPEATFVVTTADGRVEVRGTRFVVGTGPSGSTVSVDEGRVAVFARDGSERLVAAGQRLSFSAAGFVASPTPAAPTDSRPAVVEAPAPKVCPPGLACETVARRARAAMRAGQAGAALRLLEESLGKNTPGCEAPLGPPRCGDELRYLRAESLRQDGRLDDAVAAYKALDRHAAPPATRQNALYAAAQLEQRLGRPGAARADFESALAASPGGALREEALLGAMESATAAGDVPSARALARRYLSTFPAGLGARRARAIAAPDAQSPGPTP
jgi:hypothetical protein